MATYQTQVLQSCDEIAGFQEKNMRHGLLIPIFFWGGFWISDLRDGDGTFQDVSGLSAGVFPVKLGDLRRAVAAAWLRPSCFRQRMGTADGMVRSSNALLVHCTDTEVYFKVCASSCMAFTFSSGPCSTAMIAYQTVPCGNQMDHLSAIFLSKPLFIVDFPLPCLIFRWYPNSRVVDIINHRPVPLPRIPRCPIWKSCAWTRPRPSRRGSPG